MFRGLLIAIILAFLGCAKGDGFTDYSQVSSKIKADASQRVFITWGKQAIGTGGFSIPIILNGQDVGRVAMTETLIVQGKPGINTIKSDVDGLLSGITNSPMLEFEISDNEDAYFGVTHSTGLAFSKIKFYKVSKEQFSLIAAQN